MRLRTRFLQTYQEEVANGMNAAAALALLDRDAPLIAEYVRSLP